MKLSVLKREDRWEEIEVEFPVYYRFVFDDDSGNLTNLYYKQTGPSSCVCVESQTRFGVEQKLTISREKIGHYLDSSCMDPANALKADDFRKHSHRAMTAIAEAV